MIKKLLLNIPQLGKGEWWIEVMTTQPLCIYYFGPFSSSQAAKARQADYIEDLTQEGVHSIQAVVKQCQPTRLTIFDDQYRDAPVQDAPTRHTPVQDAPVRDAEHRQPVQRER
ncbi:MAG: DUF1816 domain-containing protein [Leptolyngbya sp. DLM2.Bin27]|nr:MAG: DUF1816 domain-containing protein [Leptolyngbya sp. DLM2.Bin27]